MLKMIDEIHNSIYAHDFAQVGEKVVALLEQMIANFEGKLSDEELLLLNAIMGELLQAIKLKDYLLIDDLLIHEFQPFYEKNTVQ